MSKEKYLNELVSSLGVFYVKLHQYHWYVKGPEFFTLHEKFEEYYDEVTAQFDVVAERMLMIGLKPASTLGEFLEASFIKETPYKKALSAKEMVKNVYEDYKLLVEKTQAGYEVFEGDEVTTDVLVGLEAAFGKNAWMLEFTLA